MTLPETSSTPCAAESRARRLASLLDATAEVFRADGDRRFTLRVAFRGEVRITPTNAFDAGNAWRWAEDALDRIARDEVAEALNANSCSEECATDLRRAEREVADARRHLEACEAKRNTAARRLMEWGERLASRLMELTPRRRALFDLLAGGRVEEVPR